jgi:hypothetical protein
MAGLVPAIHVLRSTPKGVDARDKRGHDDSVFALSWNDTGFFCCNASVEQRRIFLLQRVS